MRGMVLVEEGSVREKRREEVSARRETVLVTERGIDNQMTGDVRERA